MLHKYTRTPLYRSNLQERTTAAVNQHAGNHAQQRSSPTSKAHAWQAVKLSLTSVREAGNHRRHLRPLASAQQRLAA
jgi:hypothetical protein